ncbi:MAG: DUF1343 domain-containing protein [Candidatus Marinimicrobia bacterium]|nr:DUF1343 domain-containing protein [Candidatus Neomarinimicrobiota bacterium]
MNKIINLFLLGFLMAGLWSCASGPSIESGSQIPGPHKEQQLEMGKVDVPQERAVVYTGLDVLEKMNYEPLVGKTVGVITNHTAVNKQGIHLVDLLDAASDVTVGAIFAPEHGFRGDYQGGDDIPGGVDSKTGASIYSLYGDSREPSKEMMSGLDVLVFDIQDVGARFYTYISTMGYVLEAGAKYKIPVMILDRPNPLGREVGGKVLDEGFESFVGRYKIPIRYGLTMGELARMIIGEHLIPDLGPIQLHVVECEGWKADSYWQETDLEWIPPSPNMRNTNETLTYPGLCLLEGVQISEGRGTEHPFELIGAPYIEADRLIKQLLASGLKGFILEQVTFVPQDMPGVAMNPIFKGEEINGFRISVTEPHEFKPVEFLIHLLVIVKKDYPNDFGWRSERGPDRLWGSDSLRRMVDDGSSAEEIIAVYQEELLQFKESREKYLIYD